MKNITKFKKICFSIFLLTMFIVNLSFVYANNNANIEWNGKGSIEAVGYGYPPSNSYGGHAKIMARRAAIVDAYRNLAEITAGVSVDATTTVSNLQVESDIIKTNVNSVIKNARIVKEEFNSDGAYKIVMQIPLFGENSLASAVMSNNQNQTVLSFPSPSSTTTQQQPTGSSGQITGSLYTGVIIDCTGLTEINRVMSPVILNERREPIYGHQFLDPTFVVNNGMADYATHGHKDASRAGSSPLVVKAIALDKNNSTPVLSQADADMLLSANKNQNFLGKTAVVFKQDGV